MNIHWLLRKGSAIVLMALLLLSSCSKENPDPQVLLLADPARGTVHQASLVEHFTIAQLDSMVNAGVLGFLPFDLKAQNAVSLYKLIYETVDHKGHHLIASGALLVPDEASGPTPLVSYQHGTIFHKGEAPSGGVNKSQEVLLILQYASRGIVVSMPDYLGLGEGEGQHPFLHRATEASATVDMMIASRNFAGNKAFSLDKEIFLAGYSQGGHATLAAQRLIESEYRGEFALTATTPMAGPYSLSTVMKDRFLKKEAYPFPEVFPYLLLSYGEIYDLYSQPSEYFAPPYDQNLPPLYDGLHRLGDISPFVTEIPVEMIEPAVAAAFETDPKQPFAAALKLNDLDNWTARAPVRFYHCSGDLTIPIENMYRAAEKLKSRGSATSMVVVDEARGVKLTHGICAVFAIFDARDWILDQIQ